MSLRINRLLCILRNLATPMRLRRRINLNRLLPKHLLMADSPAPKPSKHHPLKSFNLPPRHKSSCSKLRQQPRWKSCQSLRARPTFGHQVIGRGTAVGFGCEGVGLSGLVRQRYGLAPAGSGMGIPTFGCAADGDKRAASSRFREKPGSVLSQ